MLDMPLDRRQLFARLGGLAALAYASPLRATSPVFKWSKVADVLMSYVADDRLPGVVGTIATGSNPAAVLAFGRQGREQTTAMSGNSLFRCYSMTKPITGMAAMMLIEDGKLALDQDVSDLIPSFRNPRVLIDGTKSLDARPARGPVTVRGLMTHSSGLGYDITSKGPLLAEYRRQGLISGVVSRQQLPGFPKVTPAPSLAAFADRIGALPLMYDPGTRWSYSAGCDVLGRVIELASGMSFDAFLRERLFAPLGMDSATFQVSRDALPRMTTNYGITPLGKVPIDPGATTIYSDPPPFPMGGSGLVMSPRDYDQFLRMLAGGGAIGRTRVMKEATVRLGMSNLLPSGVSTAGTLVAEQGFGAGGRVSLAARDRLGAGKGTYGWGGAAATVAWVDPTNGIRATGFAQFMPDRAMPFTADFGQSIYASL